MRNLFLTLFRVLIVLAALAGLAWAFSAQDSFVFGVVFGFAIGLFLLSFVRFKTPKNAEESAESTIEDTISQLGEPDRIIVVNPMRGVEPDGAILLYLAEDLFVYDNMQIQRKSVRDVTVNNAAVAFTPEAYQVNIVTNSQTYHIFTGNDIGWARNVLDQIREALVAE
ncbi:MAG: hypothetical protein IJ816_00265 [Alloprevotella sp.]|nr:hypothetical protein [Alloprevotella sp.]